jgi:hypothetical protein
MELSLAVCSNHFSEEQFTNCSSRKLKEDAIPTLFPVGHSSCNKNCTLDTQDECEEEEAVFIGNKKFWKRLIHLLSLHYFILSFCPGNCWSSCPYSALGTSDTSLCSVFALQLKTVLLDVLQLLMLSAGTLISLEDKMVPLIVFYCKQDTYCLYVINVCNSIVCVIFFSF